MDYEWVRTCLIIIAAVVAVALSASYTARTLMEKDREGERFLNARQKQFKKCDMIKSSQWAQAVDMMSSRFAAGMTPACAFPFADYVDGEAIQSPYKRAIDYGLAVAYKKPESAGIDLMVSYVFYTESLDEGGCLVTQQRVDMINAIGQALLSIKRNSARFASVQMGRAVLDDEIDRLFRGQERIDVPGTEQR